VSVLATNQTFITHPTICSGMSGWITLTIELKDGEAYWNDNEEEEVGPAAKEAFIEYGDDGYRYENGDSLQYFLGISEATNHRPEKGTHHKYLMAVVGGRFEEEEVFEMLDQVLSYSTGRAVVIHSNDTSDTGYGYLYVHRDGEWKEADAVGEKQSHEGTHLGQYAAARMYSRHGIPAIAKRHMTMEHSEVDEYSEHTLHNRPR